MFIAIQFIQLMAFSLETVFSGGHVQDGEGEDVQLRLVCGKERQDEALSAAILIAKQRCSLRMSA